MASVRPVLLFKACGNLAVDKGYFRSLQIPMTPINPSDSFRRLHPEEAIAFALACDAKWLRVGINCACAQIAHEGASAEELAGINRFIAVLLTQHTEPKSPGKLPDKSRLESYDGPAVDSEKEK